MATQQLSKGQRTEAAFLAAARETFAEKGYFNTKISDIAERAGRSAGSFYNYYDNKEQLLESLLESFTQEVVAASRIPPASNAEEGVRTGLRRVQGGGQDIGLPLDVLASALVSMLESFCWTWLAVGGDTGVTRPDDDTAIDVLTAIWFRTVYGRDPVD